MPAYPNCQDVRPAYVTSTDPGAVKPGVFWVDTTVGPPYQLKVRNLADTGWDNIGSTNTPSLPPGFMGEGEEGEQGDPGIPGTPGTSTSTLSPVSYPITAPVNGDFAWLNQGGATITETTVPAGLSLMCPATVGVAMRCRIQAVPTAPYEIKIGFIPNFGIIDGTYNPLFGLFLSDGTDAVTSKVVRFGQYLSSANGYVRTQLYKFSNVNTADVSYFDKVSYDAVGLAWLRIIDDNTDRIVGVSQTGGDDDWIDVHSVGRTDYITPTHCGFFGEAGNVTYDVKFQIISYFQG